MHKGPTALRPSKVNSWDSYFKSAIRRSLFPAQNFLFLTIGTTIICYLINQYGFDTAFEELVTIASVPINTALVFMFGMTVSRSIGARASVHSQILKAVDYPTIISMLAARGDAEAMEQAAKYRNATVASLEIIRYIAYEAFAEEVIWPGVRKVHEWTMVNHAEAGRITQQRGVRLCEERQKMISSFQEIHKNINGVLPPFHGVPLADPMGALLHNVLSPESTFEVRFAMNALSVLSVVSRSWSSDSAIDLTAIISWAAIIYVVILLPYSLIGSFVYKSNVWDTHPDILVAPQGESTKLVMYKYDFKM
jgi:hypothetical protein